MAELNAISERAGEDAALPPARWPWLLVALFAVLATGAMFLVVANDESLAGQVSYVVAFSMFAVVGALIAEMLETLQDRANDALEAQARKMTLPVTVQIDPDLPWYAREVESAVSFSTLEAMQNVTKYADASTVIVRMTRDDRALAFSVTDDGRGFDTSVMGYGTGLQGIAARLGAADGSLGVESAPGDGTTLTGSIPVSQVTV